MVSTLACAVQRCGARCTRQAAKRRCTEQGAGQSLCSDKPGGRCLACSLQGPCHVAGGSSRDCLSRVTDRTEGRESGLVRVCRWHAGFNRPHALSAVKQASSASMCKCFAQLSCPWWWRRIAHLAHFGDFKICSLQDEDDSLLAGACSYLLLLCWGWSQAPNHAAAELLRAFTLQAGTAQQSQVSLQRSINRKQQRDNECCMTYLSYLYVACCSELLAVSQPSGGGLMLTMQRRNHIACRFKVVALAQPVA